MGIRFVTPESIRLPISGGEFITIKKKLSHGERDDMHASTAPVMTPGAPLQINTKGRRSLRVAAYLIGWSSTAEMSPQMSLQDRVDTLNGLDPDDFDEIERVIFAHLEAEPDAKNDQGGAPASAPTSASAE